LEAREARVLEEVLRGNVPEGLRRLRPVRVERPDAAGALTFWAAPDYLAVGSDADHLLVPLSPQAAQRLGDALGMALPTPRMVDAIWSAAEVTLEPAPIPPSPSMTTAPVFLAHSRSIAEQRRRASVAADALVAGHKKDVVVSRALAARPDRVAIYGWHRLDGQPIQPLYLGHTRDWVDYSHGVRLVHRRIEVGGASADLWEALRDSSLAPALSHEGVVEQPGYVWE
jgi:hypothetical protein